MPHRRDPGLQGHLPPELARHRGWRGGAHVHAVPELRRGDDGTGPSRGSGGVSLGGLPDGLVGARGRHAGGRGHRRTPDRAPRRLTEERPVYRDKAVAVVIPAYNVDRFVATVVEGLPDLVDQVIVVDDASTDGTATALEAIKDPRVRVTRHPVNQGVGGAMVTGFRLALEQRPDVVVKMDGDGQMDPRYLPTLLDPLLTGSCDYTKGNRFLDGDRLAEMPAVRLVGNFVLTFLTKLVSGYWSIFDPQNGFVAISAPMLRRLPLDRLARRYFFENDMLIHLNILRARVRDVPIPARYGDERSSMRLGRVLLTFPAHLARRFWYRIYQRHILRDFAAAGVFWVVGTALASWGILFGTAMWIRSAVTGHPATTGTVMFSAVPLILGFQLLLQAILIEIQESSR